MEMNTEKYKTQKISNKRRKKIDKFVIDETQLKVSSQYILLWVAIEPKHRQILHVVISFERTMLVDERFITYSLNTCGKHTVSTSDGTTWYPQACKFLKLKHHIHSPLEKIILERTIQYIKDRTDILMIIFHVEKRTYLKNYTI